MAKRRTLDFDFGASDTSALATKADWERKLRNVQTQRRKARLAARRNALQNAVEGIFIARGWSMRDAVEMAGWWVVDRLDMAKKVMERYGYDYLGMTWRNA